MGEVKKLLIVDDQPEIRELVRETLGVSLYTIFEADSGTKALEIAEKEKPDLIIMDIMMPGELDGLQTLKILRSRDETKNCRVIFLTARGQDADVRRGLESGALEYLIKPFSPIKLISKVESLLEVD